jgi:hypothetical protein
MESTNVKLNCRAACARKVIIHGQNKGKSISQVTGFYIDSRSQFKKNQGGKFQI